MSMSTVTGWLCEQIDRDILTKESIEELTLEDIDDSVQRLLQLVVFLH